MKGHLGLQSFDAIFFLPPVAGLAHAIRIKCKQIARRKRAFNAIKGHAFHDADRHPLAGEGMPIGVMEGVPFDSIERALSPGDLFAFYSDGVSEARNRRKEEYGVERLQAQMTLHRALI